MNYRLLYKTVQDKIFMVVETFFLKKILMLYLIGVIVISEAAAHFLPVI